MGQKQRLLLSYFLGHYQGTCSVKEEEGEREQETMESMGILLLNICRALKKKADEHENLGEFR